MSNRTKGDKPIKASNKDVLKAPSQLEAMGGSKSDPFSKIVAVQTLQSLWLPTEMDEHSQNLAK